MLLVDWHNSYWRFAFRLLALSLLFTLANSILAADGDLEDLEEKQFIAAVDRAAPSVVRIETFGGLEKVEGVLVGQGATSGLVVDADGFIVSSAFNFVQQPSSILVTLPTGQRIPASVVARDRSRMLVLLKVKSKEPLPVPVAVPRSEMAAGQWSIALGRTFEGARPSMSVGIISATNRIWGKAVQTDAKISPGNYGGPLIDISGRVYGILVPASPQSQTDVAGAEWYDSGIGFAIPLVDILARVQDLKQGKDLHPGLLGIALKGKNSQADPAELAACPANAPAGKGGFKVGDKIIECSGQKISSIAQLKHALGPHYAGDRIKLVAMRGDKSIEATVELAAEISPLRHAFLGIWPRRDATRDVSAIEVRYVLPGSPAAEAGILAGDTIFQLAGAPIRDGASMHDALAAFEPGQTVKLKLKRAGEVQEVSLKLAALGGEIPEKLPPSHGVAPMAVDRPPVGRTTVKLPEQAGESVVFVPESYHPDVPHGLVVWLHAPGKFDEKELLDRWRIVCAQYDLILLAPKTADKAQWQPTELEGIRKSIDQLISKYNIDRTRIVAHGYQGGGAMAYLLAMEHRDLVRGVAAIDAALPARIASPEIDAVQRLAIYSMHSEASPAAAAILAGIKKLSAANFPLTERKVTGEVRYLDANEFAELLRWIDSLDRI